MASIWYLAMTTVLSIGQYFLERHYGRGACRDEPMTLFDQIASPAGIAAPRRARTSDASATATSLAGHNR